MKLITIFLLFLVSGCQTIKSNSTVNPSINVRALDSVAVIAVNDSSLEQNVIDLLKKHNISAFSGTSLAAFVKNEEEFKQLLKVKDINYLLFIGSNVGKVNLSFIGLNTNTNTYTSISNTSYNGNPYYVAPSGGANIWNVNTTSNTISTPMYNSTNNATSQSTLYNLNGDKIWFATINIDSQGTLYTGHSKMIEGISKGVIKELKKSNLIK